MTALGRKQPLEWRWAWPTKQLLFEEGAWWSYELVVVAVELLEREGMES